MTIETTHKAPRVISRYKAASIHLGISAILAIIVISLLVFIWYPWPYFKEIDGWPLVAMIIGIDVILGPLLTLIVFKQGKKTLRFDLSVIALIQICALSYGVWIGYSSRVVYAVFVENQFYLVQVSEILDFPQDKIKYPQFATPPFKGPQFIGARVPPKEAKSLDMVLLNSVGMGAQIKPEFYTPLDAVISEIRQSQLSKAEIQKHSPDVLPRILDFETRTGKSYLMSPLQVRGNDSHIVLIDDQTGEVVKMFVPD
jgi:hypothetical protein